MKGFEGWELIDRNKNLHQLLRFWGELFLVEILNKKLVDQLHLPLSAVPFLLLVVLDQGVNRFHLNYYIQII